MNEALDIVGRAARRAHLTGLPLDRMLKSEVARRRRQIEAGQLSPVHPAPLATVETLPSDPIPAEKLIAAGEETKAKKPRKSRAPAATGEGTAAGDGHLSSATDSRAEPDTPAAPDMLGTEDPAYIQRLANVGMPVRWKAFGQDNAGTIETVIPVGTTPREMGVPAGGEKAKPRDHVSYVVKKEDGSLVWPVTAALTLV